MPGGDGTGPMGQGPMSGRAMGYCAENVTPGFANPSPGGGYWGRGRGGGGWGRRNRFYATGLTGWQRMDVPGFAGPGAYARPLAPAMAQQQELDLLKGQAEYFEDALNGIKNRITELEAKTDK